MARKQSSRPRERSDGDDVRAQPGRNLDESPLAWLARRKDRDGQPMISAAEFDAGERLRADFWFCQMTPRVTANWSGLMAGTGTRRGPAGFGSDISDSVIAARERMGRALKAVGPELSGILVDVCCHLKGLEALERAEGWPQRSGKIVLQLALQRLARHYGLIRDDHGATASRVNHWGTPGYRPPIDPEIDRDRG